MNIIPYATPTAAAFPRGKTKRRLHHELVMPILTPKTFTAPQAAGARLFAQCARCGFHMGPGYQCRAIFLTKAEHQTVCGYCKDELGELRCLTVLTEAECTPTCTRAYYHQKLTEARRVAA